MLQYMAYQRSYAVIAKSAGMNCRRDESVPQTVHCQQGCHFSDIARVIDIGASCQGRTGFRFGGNNVNIFPVDFIVNERETDACEV